MEPSLQRVQIYASRTLGPEEVQKVVAEQGIQFPSPSAWPLLLSMAICAFMAGLLVLFVTGFPWVTLLSLLFVLVGILGWALEDPHAQKRRVSPISLMPTTKLNAVQGETQASAVRPVASDRTTAIVYPAKEMEEDPTARRNSLGRIRLRRF